MTTHYHPDDFKHLEEKHEITNVDMTGYTNEEWYEGIYKYLEETFTPLPPKKPKKPLTKEALKRQKIMVINKIREEFDKRFPELLVRDLF